jgi:hypothetical protein
VIKAIAFWLLIMYFALKAIRQKKYTFHTKSEWVEIISRLILSVNSTVYATELSERMFSFQLLFSFKCCMNGGLENEFFKLSLFFQ